MIPDLVHVKDSPWPLLPPGIYDSTLEEIYNRYAINTARSDQFEGLSRALQNLFVCGCIQVFLDGSYVTGKPIPNDYEVCWDITLVEPAYLDPVFFDFSNGRQNQKNKYYGEFFPAQIKEGMSGKPFLDFFQTDKFTGKPKGIVRLVNHLMKGGLI